MSEYTAVGYTQKSHGVKGEIKIKLQPEFINNVLDAEILFINRHGKIIPFFLEDIKAIGKLYIAKFEDVDSPEQATQISSSEVLLPADAIQIEEEELQELEYHFIQGFEVHDEEKGLIGTIKEILEYPQQEMAVVFFGKKEILIPLHEDLIIELDEEKKRIRFELPEGLLDL